MLNIQASTLLCVLAVSMLAMNRAPELGTLWGRILAARKAAGLSQEAIAQKLHITKGAVSQWENGEVQNLRLPNLFALAKVLRVEAQWLATGEGPRAVHRSGPEREMLDRWIAAFDSMTEQERALAIGLFENRLQIAASEPDPANDA